MESMSMMLGSQKPDENTIQQSVMVQSKPLEHLYSLDRVAPFFQKLFYVVELSEMITIANMMIDMSSIKKGKHGIWRVEVKTLEEVQGILINKQRESSNVVQKKDETLLRRKAFNIKVLRPRFMQENQSSASFVDAADLQGKLILRENENEETRAETRQENYVRMLQSRLRNFMRRRAHAIASKKHVNVADDVSIRNYVKNFIPTTEYGIYEEQGEGEDHLETSVVVPAEEAVAGKRSAAAGASAVASGGVTKRVTIPDSRVLFDGEAVLFGDRVYLQVFLMEQLFQVIVLATVGSGAQLKAQISRSALLPAEEINADFLAKNVDRFVTRQLRVINGELLVFKPDVALQSELAREQIEWVKQRSKEVAELKPVESDLEKYWFESLVEAGRPAIRLDLLTHREYEVEFIYERSEHTFWVAVYRRDNLRVRAVYQYPAKEFQCLFLNQEVPNRGPEEVQKFFSPIVHQVNVGLRVIVHEDSLETSWEEMQMHLPQILKDKVILKIQGMLQIRRLMGKLKLYRESRKQEIFLGRYVECHDLHYTEEKYFLVKERQCIKLLIKELNTIDGSGAIIEQNKRGENSKFQMRQRQFFVSLREIRDCDMDLVVENLKRSEQMSLQRLNLARVDQFNVVRTLDYYRQLLSPLVQVIHSNLHIRYPSNVMQIQLLNLCIPFIEEKWVPKKRKMQKGPLSVPWKTVVKAAMKMQQEYKKQRMKDWYKIKQRRKKELEEKRRYLGRFVKRQYRRFGKQLYLVNVYRRDDKREGSKLFTFELIPYCDRVKDQGKEKVKDNKGRLRDLNKLEQRKKGYFSWEPTMMLSIGGQSLCEYLMDLLYIDGETGQVRVREWCFEKLGANVPSPLPLVAEEQQPDTQQLVQEEVPEKLVHHVELRDETVPADVSGVLYNVVYTGSNRLAPRPGDGGTVKIEVDLREVSKLYPTLSSRNPELMKVIGQNLIDGVRVREDGEVEVDRSKITPELLRVVENSVGQQKQQLVAPTATEKTTAQKRVQSRSSVLKQEQFQQQLQQQQQQQQQHHRERAAVKETLVKKTTVYNGMKYLVVVSYLERRVGKILESARDKVFEDFESVFEVQATNLSNVKEAAILWEMSSEEAMILSRKQRRSEVAHSLAKRIQVLNGKFIFLAEEQRDILAVRVASRNVILFVEKGIRPIQHRFRNRGFQQQYRSYREKLREFRVGGTSFTPAVAAFELNSLKSSKQQFITMVCEDSQKRIQVFAWDVDNFFFYEIEVQRQKYIQQFAENKTMCLRAMLHFVEFQPETRTLAFLYPKPEVFQEYFEEEKRQNQLQASTRIKGHPDMSGEQQQQVQGSSVGVQSPRVNLSQQQIPDTSQLVSRTLDQTQLQQVQSGRQIESSFQQQQ